LPRKFSIFRATACAWLAWSRLRAGECVWITLPGLPPRQAKVIWVERFEAGCAFIEPLHEAVFDAIVAGHMH
jgi:hypothetical protein